jgi:16S rRNA (cytidine1402-2'-O)-methyltransferase
MGSDPTDAAPARPLAKGSTALAPGLYVVSTPIGNLRDITLRALDVLASADRLYAEDTRVSRKLLSAYGISARLSTYHDHSEARDRDAILAELGAGRAVALLSDAGTPLVSDPGFKLVRAAIAAGHDVFAIPGASAALAALTVAGLAPDRFLFLGFPPPGAAQRRAWLADLAGADATLIIYEAGPRLAESLADMFSILGPRQAAVCCELTKLFERTTRGTLSDLADAFATHPFRGEFVVVVDGAPEAAPATAEAIDAALREALARTSVRDAAAEVAARLGAPRREVYARALALQGGTG